MSIYYAPVNESAIYYESKSNQCPIIRFQQPLGILINSKSTIYFGLNAVVETTVVSQLVGEDFIVVILKGEEVLLDNEMIVAPNPASSSMRIEIPTEYKNLSYVLYNTNGSVLTAANTVSNVFYIYRDFIPSGMYFLEIRTGSTILGTKKIVFQD